MSRAPNASSDLTLIVFKDNLAAKSFKVPLQWMSRIGMVVLGVSVLTVCSGYLAFKYYNMSREANPELVEELTDQLKIIEAKNLELAEEKLALEASHSELRSQVGKAGVTSAGSVGPLPGFSPLIQKLPAGTSVPIEVSNVRQAYANQKLTVGFDLLYTKEDGRSQRGRIFVFARGPNTLYAYPQTLLNSLDQGSLVTPERGEFFSVSRFRTTEAEFKPVHDVDQINRIEIIITSNKNELLIRKTIPVSVSEANESGNK